MHTIAIVIIASGVVIISLAYGIIKMKLNRNKLMKDAIDNIDNAK